MAATIHRDRRTVDRRLNQYFNSRRGQWVEIVKVAVAARARCTADNARSAPGYYAWDAATARMRQIFCREGWQRGDHNGIETIVNHDFEQTVAVMNTDAGTANHLRSPRNRTSKGPACERVIDLNGQVEMFKRREMGAPKERPYSFWYLCIFDDGKQVRAELATPIEFSASYVIGFSERIFILEDGDWEKISIQPPADEPSQEYQIDVRRK
jgi:hypothetical protein